jgi:ADP-heptose:LPS heptosyltransferase
MKILISPYSQKLPKEGLRNPKNFPYWKEVVALIKQKIPNATIVQVGVSSEAIVDGITYAAHNFSQTQLLELARTCNAWMSVDNFFQHFCAYYKIPNGIAIFGQSDPLIFGHSFNTNLLKDRKYLRGDQFLYWWHDSVKYKEEAFVSAETVVETLFKKLNID